MNLFYFILGIVASIVIARLWDSWFKLPSTKIINIQEELIAALICLLMEQSEENGTDEEKNPLHWLGLAKQIVINQGEKNE